MIYESIYNHEREDPYSKRKRDRRLALDEFGAIIISVTLLYLATVVPFMQVALNTVPLRAVDWGLIVLVTSSIFLLGEIRKFIWRRIRRDG
jgi:hypothetical protein